MKKSIKTKLAMLSLVGTLLIGGTVGGTLAWLIAESNPVVNTFTVGDITLTLSETFNTDSTNDGVDNKDKWIGKIVPGGEDGKDPKLTVGKGSEKCYVYVLIDNNVVVQRKIGDVEKDITVAEPNISSTDWTKVGESGTKILYRYKEEVNAGNEEVPCTVFTKVKYDEYLTKAELEKLGDKTITITGYAHQSVNTDQKTADAAAVAWANGTSIANNP